MVKTNGNNLLLILGAVLVVGILSSVLTVSITGNAFLDRVVRSSNVRANSCDADAVCELKTITTPKNSRNDLALKSDTGKVSVNGEIVMLSVPRATISAKRDLILAPSDDLIIQPGEGVLITTPVEIQGDVITNGLFLSSNLVTTKEGSNADLMLASETGTVVVDGSIVVTGLNGQNNPQGHAIESVGYICISADGKLLKKLVPCV